MNIARRARPIAGVLILGAALAAVLTACAAVGDSRATATLLNTYWKLVTIRDQPVTVVENQREPHFVLHLDNRRLGGHGGCNHLIGRYRTQGTELRFEDVGSTLMACARGMDTEAAFLQALRETTHFKIRGERLELYGNIGNPLATFESVYLR